jgi:nucleoside-diphosphate-sugar epimerase
MTNDATMNILVTGATGVVGRRAVPLLLAAGHRVTVTARSPGRTAELAAQGARVVSVNLFDTRELREALSGHDTVVNLATHMPAMGFRMLLPGAWRENDRLRSIAAARLAKVASTVGVRRFIQESFAPTYPDYGERWITEGMPLAPERYNRSVVDAEQAALRFTASGGCGVVLRFGAFYGPDAAQTRALVAWLRRGWAPLPGRPDAFVSSLSHDDAAAAVLTALRASPGTYNVVDNEPLRRRDYFDSLAGLLGVPPPKMPPPWTGHLLGSVGRLLARSLRISNRKLRRSCGWTPRYPSAREGWRAVLAELAA